MSSSRGPGYLIGAWLPVALGIGVVAAESTQVFGSDHTTGPLRWVVQLFFGTISDQRWSIVHLALRKCGHFVGYGLLGLAWLRAWRMTKPHWPFIAGAMLALASTAVIAGCDELHQTFLANRTGSPWDVVTDCSGALVLAGFVYLKVRFFDSNETGIYS